jgi:hypothetical protein
MPMCIRILPHRTLSHFAARRSQLLYRRLNGWLHRAIGATHINGKILVDRHVGLDHRIGHLASIRTQKIERLNSSRG